MNRKKLARIVAVVLCVFSALFLCGAGCQNAADDSVSLNADEQKLVGTWKIDFSAGSNKSQIEAAVDSIGGMWYNETITANDQKRAAVQIYYNTGSAWSSTTMSTSGSWSASGGVLTLIPDNTSYFKVALTYTLSPDGKTMTVALNSSTNMVFKKQ